MAHSNFPTAQVIESTSVVYQDKIGAKSQFIYLLCCALLIASFASLFFVTVPVNVSAYAIIRPSSELSSVRPLVSGRIKELSLKENQAVHKGDVLLTIESEIQEEREHLLLLKQHDLKIIIGDLIDLVGSNKVKELNTSLYKQAYFSYRQKVMDASTRFKKARTDFDRNRKLHQEAVIADVEFEGFQFELQKAENDLELVKEIHLSQWQEELRTFERELQDIEGELARLIKEKESLVIKAPVTGTLQNVTGAYVGSIVFSNQEIAQISPDTNLIVETYLSPNDIGFIQANMQVRFQVDAFNYNQWGLATGSVQEISSDIHLIDNKPMFKIRCILNQNFLQLKNGYKGHMKKGMTLRARFMITKRTLWQLLYDKADDWLNPNVFQH